MGRGGSGAGQYWQRVRHYPRTADTAGATGFKRPNFEEGSDYWCYTKDAKANVVLAYGIQNVMVEIEIHLRGYPPVGSLDRFRVLTDDRYCDTKGLKYDYDAGETVIMAKYIPTLDAT